MFLLHSQTYISTFIAGLDIKNSMIWLISYVFPVKTGSFFSLSCFGSVLAFRWPTWTKSQTTLSFHAYVPDTLSRGAGWKPGAQNPLEKFNVGSCATLTCWHSHVLAFRERDSMLIYWLMLKKRIKRIKKIKEIILMMTVETIMIHNVYFVI